MEENVTENHNKVVRSADPATAANEISMTSKDELVSQLMLKACLSSANFRNDLKLIHKH